MSDKANHPIQYKNRLILYWLTCQSKIHIAMLNLFRDSALGTGPHLKKSTDDRKFIEVLMIKNGAMTFIDWVQFERALPTEES